MSPNEPANQPQEACKQIVQACKRVLEGHYGDRFAGLVLYGSVARGEADQESDIDLLVLLKGEFDYFEELRTIIDILFPTQLECDQLISATPAGIVEFQAGRLQLYRNAQQEGISV